MNSRSERFGLAVACLLTLLLGIPYVQCLGDDTFIYMRVIENFLESGRIEFNVGEPAYLVTSTTWFFLWTAFTYLIGDIDVARYALSALFHIAAFLSTWLVARRLIGSPYLRLIALTVAFVDPFYLRWMWAGWESGMKITMASLSLWALLRLSGSSSGRTYFFTGLLIGLAFLTRPEMAVLVVLGYLYAFVKFPAARTRLFAYTGGLVLAIAPWMIYAYFEFGWPVPHTIFAMSGREVDARYLLTQGIKFVQVVGTPVTIPFLLLAIAAVLRIRRGGDDPAVAQERTPIVDWLLVATWSAAVIGYLITGSYVASIYTGLFVPSLAVTLTAAVEWLMPARAPHWPAMRATLTLLALSVLLSIGIQSRLYYRYSLFNPQFRGGVDARFIDFATSIEERTDPDAEIGLWELGVIGYFSERYIVDFAGLATPEIVTYMRRLGDDYAVQYLRDRGHYPEYMVKHYPKGDDAGMGTSVRDFFGAEYVPILSQAVQRVGGKIPPGHYDLYVLYRRNDSSPGAQQSNDSTTGDGTES